MNKSKCVLVLALICGCLVIGMITYHFRWFQTTGTERLPDLYEGSVPDISETNQRILAGAIDYINTKPKYKSKYYETGYPEDGYGVCTDVVAIACKQAGFDLMELVSADIERNRSEYDIKEPDRAIDFRRVKNLKVFFDNNAESLTLDLKEIEQWQGGDIIIFKNHIGIVSDRRNKNGVPYVIHHNDSFQKQYEEDILENRTDMVGHYRL